MQSSNAKQKRQGFHPYRLMFIFPNADGMAAAGRFLYPNLCVESLRQCELIPIIQAYPESCYIQCKTKAVGLPPYRLTFIFSQRRRHGFHTAFSLPESVHRIAPPMQIDSHHTSLFWKLLHLMQNKSGRASTIPLNVYFFPTQTARLPQGVFSTRICASNRSANADTWEIIPTMQS